MMTWHTRFSFFRTAEDLTDEHLREQIMTGWDLYQNLEDSKQPAAYMWRGYGDALLIRGMIFCLEWSFKRNYDDKQFWKYSREADARRTAGTFDYVAPPWFRDADVCRSHRSQFVAANPEAYSETWADVPARMPVLWPVLNPEIDALYELRVAKQDLAACAKKQLIIPKSMRERVVNA